MKTGQKKLRTIHITFTEYEVDGSPDKTAFRLQLTGDVERIGKTNVGELSPAEWWGLKALQMIKGVIQKAATSEQMGVLKAVEEKRLRSIGRSS